MPFQKSCWLCWQHLQCETTINKKISTPSKKTKTKEMTKLPTHWALVEWLWLQMLCKTIAKLVRSSSGRRRVLKIGKPSKRYKEKNRKTWQKRKPVHNPQHLEEEYWCSQLLWETITKPVRSSSGRRRGKVDDIRGNPPNQNLLEIPGITASK